MKKQLLKLKEEKKQLASKIVDFKKQRKGSENGYVYGLLGTQQDYRVKHIVHCLLRGRTMEQIENKHRCPEDYNHKWIKQRVEKLMKEIQEEVAREQALCADTPRSA